MFLSLYAVYFKYLIMKLNLHVCISIDDCVFGNKHKFKSVFPYFSCNHCFIYSEM